MFYVYLIKSTRYDWVYVGSTSNLENRLHEHNAGAVRSTKFRRPYVLIYSETFDKIGDARRREKSIKADRIEKERIVKKLGLVV
ncbi:MAG: GIY-YIG nuclease family protein [bacterium]|nr:GIY-YIG nuclease family protein [bacterium]